MSQGENQEYGPEVERLIKTKPHQPMPDFEPLITETMMAQLNKLNPHDRALALPLMNVMSIMSQQNSYTYNDVGGVKSVVRDMEYRQVTKKQNWKGVLAYLAGGAAIAFMTALAEHLMTK